MLIYCPSCENECSEQAESCPKCGHPLTSTSSTITPITAPAIPLPPPVVVRPIQTVQTIEKTGKDWKVLILLSSVAMLIGSGTCIAGFNQDDTATVGTGAVIFSVGLVVYIVGRIGAWWDHG